MAGLATSKRIYTLDNAALEFGCCFLDLTLSRVHFNARFNVLTC